MKRVLVEAGLNFFAFDGPGQGEMWKAMKFTLDYHRAVSAIIDYLDDRRIRCAVGNSGFARIGGLAGARKLNPIWQRGVSYLTGCDDFEEAVRRFDLDITLAPRLDRPFLFFHAGRDDVMPTPKLQADTFMEWASGKKELVYCPEAEHCTVDYLDEVFPYIVDWLRRHLAGAEAGG